MVNIELAYHSIVVFISLEPLMAHGQVTWLNLSLLLCFVNLRQFFSSNVSLLLVYLPMFLSLDMLSASKSCSRAKLILKLATVME